MKQNRCPIYKIRNVYLKVPTTLSKFLAVTNVSVREYVSGLRGTPTSIYNPLSTIYNRFLLLLMSTGFVLFGDMVCEILLVEVSTITIRALLVPYCCISPSWLPLAGLLMSRQILLVLNCLLHHLQFT